MVNFRLFGIPVGVHLSFLIIIVLGPLDSAQSAITWLLAAFVAIMLHEFGHALSARAFGAKGIEVTLYGLGGLTSFSHPEKVSHGKSFLISGAGSAVGIVAGLAVVGLGRLDVFVSWPDAPVNFLEYFVFVALVWGILNWIPIVPLDGGHMAQHFIAIFNEEKAPLIAQIVTWVAVAVVVPIAIINGYEFGAIIVVMFAIFGLREFRAGQRRASAPGVIDAASRELGDQEAPEPEGLPQEPPPSFPI
jgi:Zn-dependent protease